LSAMHIQAYHRGTLTYSNGTRVEAVTYYYPVDIKWSCMRCGNCCGDLPGRTRRILLLPEEIRRLEETGAKDFYVPWSEGRFMALMRKKGGKCVFYDDGGCSIYQYRPLICRTYPFWLEKQDDAFIFGVDPECPGVGSGVTLGEGFFADLLDMALKATSY